MLGDLRAQRAVSPLSPTQNCQGDYKTLSSMPTEFSRMLLISNEKETRRKEHHKDGIPCPFLCYEAPGWIVATLAHMFFNVFLRGHITAEHSRYSSIQHLSKQCVARSGRIPCKSYIRLTQSLAPFQLLDRRLELNIAEYGFVMIR